MRPLRYLSALLLLFAAACVNQMTVPTTPQGAVNEANVTLTATATVIGQNVKDGIFTPDEGGAYLAKVRELAKRVDEAQALIDAGLPSAKDQAEIVRRLILALHKEVAQRARRPS